MGAAVYIRLHWLDPGSEQRRPVLPLVADGGLSATSQFPSELRVPTATGARGPAPPL